MSSRQSRKSNSRLKQQQDKPSSNAAFGSHYGLAEKENKKAMPQIDLNARIIVADTMADKQGRFSRRNQYLNDMVRLVTDSSIAELAEACEIKGLND